MERGQGQKGYYGLLAGYACDGEHHPGWVSEIGDKRKDSNYT